MAYIPARPLAKHGWWFAVGAILVAVLPPEPLQNGPGPPFLLGLVPASRAALFDALLNVCLYVPLGVALAARHIGRGRAVAAACLLSGATELLQVIIPGRDPSLSDVLANTTGALTGTILLSGSTHSPRRWFVALDEYISRLLDPERCDAGLLSFIWAAIVAATLVVSVRLLVPAPLPPPYLVAGGEVDIRAAPARNGSDAQPGKNWSHHHLADASMNGEPLASGLLQRAPVISKALHDGVLFRATIVCGEKDRSVAPVFALKGLWNLDMFTLSADRDDLLVISATWPRRLHMRSPPARAGGAISECTPGRKLALEVSGPLQSPRVRVGKLMFQGSTPGIASAWAFVLHSELLWEPLRTGLSLAWLAALVVPFGFWARKTVWTLGGAVLLVLAGFLAPPFWHVPPELREALALVAGVGAGILVRGRARRRNGD